MQPPRHSGCGWLQLARIQREPSGPVLSGGQRAEILTAESSALPSREKSCDGEGRNFCKVFLSLSGWQLGLATAVPCISDLREQD